MYPMRIQGLVLISFLLLGCGQGSAPVSSDMTSSPVGIWVSSQPSGIDLDVDPSGSLKMTKGGVEVLGSWKKLSEGKMEMTINGTISQSDFQRLDQKLTLTLPGESTPTEFAMM
jgi:hypothetical protein